jgi:hypothetical protein
MKYIPDEKQIEELLENSSLTPGARLDRRLANAPWTPQAIARRRFVNATLFTVLAFAFLIAATPPGRAFAQSVLRYFVRTENDTRPVPTLTLATPNADSVDPFSITRLPFEKTCGDIYHAHCSLSEIRAIVTFPVNGLGETVEDLTFVGATGGPEQVMLVYMGESVNGSLIISVGPVTTAEQRPLQVAASAEVEPVSINGAAGEYVQGAWYSVGVNNGVSWTADPFVQTLRWEMDSIGYTMTFHAAKDTGILLDKPAMLYMAENMTMKVDAIVSPPASAMEVQDLSQQAGFRVVEPGWVPEGYVFSNAAYTSDQNTACLYYNYGKGNLPVLAIAERPSASSILEDITTAIVDFDGEKITVPVVTEQLGVGRAQGGQAVLVSNGVNTSKLCPNKDFTANRALYWQFDGKDYVLFGLMDQYEGGVFISRLEMQRLAENLTGVSTIPNKGLDPQRLLSAEDAKNLAGFKVKLPTQIIPGLHLDHAAIAIYLASKQTRLIAGPFDMAGRETETVVLVYTPQGSPTRGGIDYGLFINQSAGTIRSLEEISGWGGADEYITVNGQTAFYRQFCWDTLTGGTDCRQELYWHENGIGYAITAYLPGTLEKETFIAIAESMK